jgi:hypothetical protein
LTVVVDVAPGAALHVSSTRYRSFGHSRAFTG